MMDKQTPQLEPSIFERMRNRLTLDDIPTDDRGRMRMVVDILVLHIHPCARLTRPRDFLGFSAGISSDDSPFPSRVGSVYFSNPHWDQLDDRF